MDPKQIQNFIRQKTGIEIQLAFIEEANTRFSDIAASWANGRPALELAPLIYDYFLLSPLHKAYFCPINDLMRLLDKKSHKRPNERSDIIVFQKKRPHQLLFEEHTFTQRVLAEVVMHEPYDLLGSAALSFPLELQARINTKAFPLLLAVAPLNAATANNQQFLLPGAKILLQKFSIQAYGDDFFVRVDQYQLLGGAVQDQINETVQNHRMDLQTFYINQINEKVRSILDNDQQRFHAYASIRDVVRSKIAQYQIQRVKLMEIK